MRRAVLALLLGLTLGMVPAAARALPLTYSGFDTKIDASASVIDNLGIVPTETETRSADGTRQAQAAADADLAASLPIRVGTSQALGFTFIVPNPDFFRFALSVQFLQQTFPDLTARAAVSGSGEVLFKVGPSGPTALDPRVFIVLDLSGAGLPTPLGGAMVHIDNLTTGMALSIPGGNDAAGLIGRVTQVSGAKVGDVLRLRYMGNLSATSSGGSLAAALSLSGQVTAVPIPEPGSLVLLLLGAAGLAGARRRAAARH